MKKIILSIVVVLFVSNVFSIVITQENAGPSGYDKITETHDGLIFVDHTLTCSDPGLSACEWKIEPMTPVGSSNGIKNNVMQMIGNGQLSGTLDLDNGVIVTWTAEDVFNFVINIDWEN